MVAFVCTFVMMPSVKLNASNTVVNGGHSTRISAFNWGLYSPYNSLTVMLPAEEYDFWVQVSVPSNNKVYAKCSYDSFYEGMYLTMRNSNGSVIDFCSIEDAYGLDSSTPFLAVSCDNTSSVTKSFYIHISRGDYVGNMFFSISMNSRIKKGRGTFNFPGTANNPGNSSMSLSGTDSSILTLNLTFNSTIPNGAIVTLVNTTGSQSPNQGNVHHLIQVDNSWYTSKYANASSGSFNITADDCIEVKQQWRFKYNTLASAKSSMRNIKLVLNWEYDISQTGYETF